MQHVQRALNTLHAQRSGMQHSQHCWEVAATNKELNTPAARHQSAHIRTQRCSSQPHDHVAANTPEVTAAMPVARNGDA